MVIVMKRLHSKKFLIWIGLLCLVLPSTQFMAINSTSSPETSQAEFLLQSFSGVKNVTCFTSPDSSFETTLHYLQSAKSSIYVEIYSISNGFLTYELDAATQRGVTDIKVLLSSNRASGAETYWSRAAAYNLTQAGIPVRWTSDDFRFTHAKFIIIDGKTTIIQSANWAKTSIPPDPTRGNREWGVVIHDQEVANYFNNVFTNDWIISTEYQLDPEHNVTLSANIDRGKYPHPFNASTFVEEMTIIPVLSPDTAVDAILNLIASSNQTLYVQQMYIKMEWDGADDLFLEALIAATQRGVEVKVILDGDSSGMNETAQYLSSAGAQVRFDNNTYFQWQHNKGVVVDGKVVLISSINWSFESTHENREAGVIIHNPNAANYFGEIFAWDWVVSQPFDAGNDPVTVSITETTTVILPEVGFNILFVLAIVGIIPLIKARFHTEGSTQKRKS